ncbi:MAG: low molecular weight phosphotyrosine protein phosphatase [Betaproteobacteria bacterium]|nr:MAG: low molecular weight phosphotyrosine protein phosphatase [Betaproteobacteria bacterium]
MGEPRDQLTPVRVLFVCTGNICRSPTAEGVFRHLVKAENLHQHVLVDSAGTTGYHVGEQPDHRSMRAAAQRGYDLTDLRARLLVESDFVEFDYLLAMDLGHRTILEAGAPDEHRQKVSMFLDFSQKYGGHEVPDPYYGGGQGFEFVLDMIEDGAAGLLSDIKKKLGR